MWKRYHKDDLKSSKITVPIVVLQYTNSYTDLNILIQKHFEYCKIPISYIQIFK